MTSFILSPVCPSQSLNKNWYDAWVACKSNGEIKTAFCQCMAGQGRACSHIAAILYKLEAAHAVGKTGKTCTDEPCTWNQGLKRSVVPLPLDKLDFKKPKQSRLAEQEQASPTQQVIYKTPSLQTENAYLDQIKSSGLETLFNTEGSILNSTFSKIEPIGYHGDHGTRTCIPCNKFYEEFINLPARVIDFIQAETVDQSTSDLWKEVRSIRVTSSSAHDVPRRVTTDPITFLINKVYPTFKGNRFTEHGIRSEDTIRQLIADKYGTTVLKSGVRICKENPWLCGSPDGLLGNTLLEIKSPDVDLLGFMTNSNTYDVNVDLDNLNFTLNPNGSRGFYLQVQLTMYILKIHKCLFLFYLAKSSVVIDIDVEFNESYVNMELGRLQSFYFTSMLPFLTSRYRVRALLLTETIKVVV